MAGTDRLNRSFTIADQVGSDSCIENTPNQCGGYLGSGYDILDDKIDIIDTLGVRAKITYVNNNVNIYVQGAYRGLVADSGWDPLTTFTGWSLRESGQGNNYNFFAGTAINFGSFQIAPNFMFQKPLEGPLPLIEDQFDASTGDFFPGVRPRSLLDDPFWVRGQPGDDRRFELMLGYDPTGSTWAWAWDNIVKEDAEVRGLAELRLPGAANLPRRGRGASRPKVSLFAFSGAPLLRRDLWEVRGRMIFNPSPEHPYRRSTGTAASNNPPVTTGGLVNGGRRRLPIGPTRSASTSAGFLKINDWGPYDFQRDFNLTFPLQLLGDVSRTPSVRPSGSSARSPGSARRSSIRTLDEFSPRFLADPNDPDKLGNEWELQDLCSHHALREFSTSPAAIEQGSVSRAAAAVLASCSRVPPARSTRPNFEIGDQLVIAASSSSHSEERRRPSVRRRSRRPQQPVRRSLGVGVRHQVGHPRRQRARPARSTPGRPFSLPSPTASTSSTPPNSWRRSPAPAPAKSDSCSSS